MLRLSGATNPLGRRGWREGDGAGGERQVTACIFRPQSLWNGPGDLGREDSSMQPLCACVAETHGEGFIEFFHTILPPIVELFQGIPWRFQQETGPHTGGPGSRPQVPALPTFGPAASRGTTLRSGTRVPGGALCAQFSQGNGGQEQQAEGRASQAVPPAGCHPSSPGPTTPGLSGSLPKPQASLRDREAVEVGGRGSRGIGFGRSPRLQAGGEAITAGAGRSFYRSPDILRRSRSSPRYRRRRLRLGARCAPGITCPDGPCRLAVWQARSGLAVPRRPPSHPSARSLQPRSLTSCRGAKRPSGSPPPAGLIPAPLSHPAAGSLVPILWFPGLQLPIP